MANLTILIHRGWIHTIIMVTVITVLTLLNSGWIDKFNASVVTLKLLIAIYGCVNGRYTIHNGRILEITLNATDFTQKTAAGITSVVIMELALLNSGWIYT